MPFLLLVQHSSRTPLLFILRDCGLMRNDEGRQAAEWVGIHMLQSTGKPIRSAHAHAPSHKHTLVFMCRCHQPEKSPAVLMCNVLSLSTYPPPHINVTEYNQSSERGSAPPPNASCPHSRSSHGSACMSKVWDFVHSGQLYGLQVLSERIN